MRRAFESILWGFFCTSSWTWCIGMYLPFILLRLWGWPGFWAFFIPNVLGCAAFGFVLDRARSRMLMRRLGWMCALFSAVTLAYQAYFAGWAAEYFVVQEGALRTVVATGVPIAMLVAGLALALRSDAFWRVAAGVTTAATALLMLLPRAVPELAPGADLVGRMGPDALLSVSSGGAMVGLGALGFALPTITAGFLISPYFDLSFHRAAQEAPMPRVAFATFGIAFAAMLLGVASFYDPMQGAPAVGWQLAAIWGIQLLFTIGVHMRELLTAISAVRIPSIVAGGLTALAVLLATPAFLFTLGPAAAPGRQLHGGSVYALLPGEPLYLTFLGAYGLLFPVLGLLERRSISRQVTGLVLLAGVPCYLLGAYDFQTALMPVPILLALMIATWPRAGGIARGGAALPPLPDSRAASH